MSPIIDLRRFLRAGDRGTAQRADGGEVRLTYRHVSTRWATADAPRGAVRIEDTLRAALARDGCRLAVAFEVLECAQGSEFDSIELTVTSATVLGERRTPTAGASGDAATAIHVRSDGNVVRVAARVLEMAGTGLVFEGDDRFAPGDELTLAADGPSAFRVRVRVVRRSHGQAAAAIYDCRVVAATADDEQRLRALVS